MMKIRAEGWQSLNPNVYRSLGVPESKNGNGRMPCNGQRPPTTSTSELAMPGNELDVEHVTELQAHLRPY